MHSVISLKQISTAWLLNLLASSSEIFASSVFFQMIFFLPVSNKEKICYKQIVSVKFRREFNFWIKGKRDWQ